MEALNSVLVEILGPMGPLLVVGGLGILLILGTLPFMMKKDVDPLEKLKRSNAERTVAPVHKDRLRTAKSNKKLERYSTFLEPQNEKEMSAMRIKMLQAGQLRQRLFGIMGHGYPVAPEFQGAGGLFGQRFVVLHQQQLALAHAVGSVSFGQSMRAWVQRGPNSISRLAPNCCSVVLTRVRPIPMPSRSDAAWPGPSSLTCSR